MANYQGNAPVQTGLERLIDAPPKSIKDSRLGLLCNPASVDRHFRHARFLIAQKFPGQLKALFSPQHGFFAEKQDNMIESQDLHDPALNIPVFSLYAKTRTPTKEMLKDIDILIIDLQDVGTRVYTFIYTMSFCMEAARKYGQKILVLDRPNPIGGRIIEGNVLSEDCTSFVGRYPIPMRHGLTVGELALLFNDAFEIGCELELIPMSGWKRNMFFQDTKLPWIPPSPNLPTPISTLVYPGQVIWEGTNVSEGRGTTLPFEIFGAPFLDPDKIISFVGGDRLKGAILREIGFEPTSNKWQETPCRGFQIHVIDPHVYEPYLASMTLLRAVLALHGDRFQWKTPPYEYEFERLPIDLILGSKKIRQRLEKLEEIEDITASWQEDLNRFDTLRHSVFQY